MEISGKIIQKLPLQSGESKTSGKPWQLQSYILETQEQYPRKVCFEIFGEQRIKDNPCEIDEVQQGIADGAVTAAAPAAGATAQPAQPMAAANVETFDPSAGESTDDLPF